MQGNSGISSLFWVESIFQEFYHVLFSEGRCLFFYLFKPACVYGCFLKCFLLKKYIKIIFFLFFKIIFDISVSK
jgi:hypothetical protein